MCANIYDAVYNRLIPVNPELGIWQYDGIRDGSGNALQTAEYSYGQVKDEPGKDWMNFSTSGSCCKIKIRGS